MWIRWGKDGLIPVNDRYVWRDESKIHFGHAALGDLYIEFANESEADAALNRIHEWLRYEGDIATDVVPGEAVGKVLDLRKAEKDE